MSGNSINQNPMPQSSLSAAAGKADDDNHSDNNSCNSRTSCNSNSNERRDAEPETADLHHLMKSLQQEQDKQNHHHHHHHHRNSNPSDSGSSNGGNNSDNSALISLGNTSFGFNFDSDERYSNNDRSKEGSGNGSSGGDSNTDETDSDGNERQQNQQQHLQAKKNKKFKALSGESSKPTAKTTSNAAAMSVASAVASVSTAPFLPPQQVLHHEISSLTTSSSDQNCSDRSPNTKHDVSSATEEKSPQQPPPPTLSEDGLEMMETESDAANDAANAMKALVNKHYRPEKTTSSSADRKRKAHCTTARSDTSNSDGDDDSGGYNTDDDEGKLQTSSNGKKASSKRNKQPPLSNKSHHALPPLSNKSSAGAAAAAATAAAAAASASISGGSRAPVEEVKREERNQREKERSFRISKQITELRELLSSGGVVVPKGTKSSVLTEAANYIRMLQQKQYRSEIDRHQLVQQMQLVGGGAHGPQAAQAIRHVAAQNGVWSLGSFGGVPPKSALTPFYNPTVVQGTSTQQDAPKPISSNPLAQTKIEASEYRFIFNSCGVAIAIASMGGAFIDCNHLFCQLVNYTKQELCSLTVFNLTARQDLQAAFDQISQLISPPMEEVPSLQDAASAGAETPPPPQSKPIVLRGSMNNRDDLGMSVSLVRGDDGIAKCFCVTLVRNPSSPFDIQRPVPVSYNAILDPNNKKDDGNNNNNNMAPAFTSG